MRVGESTTVDARWSGVRGQSQEYGVCVTNGEHGCRFVGRGANGAVEWVWVSVGSMGWSGRLSEVIPLWTSDQALRATRPEREFQTFFFAVTSVTVTSQLSVVSTHKQDSVRIT